MVHKPGCQWGCDMWHEPSRPTAGKLTEPEGCLLPREREPCLLRGLTFPARQAPSVPGWDTRVDGVSVMTCAGAGWSRGMAFRVGPRLRRGSGSLAPAPATFQRQQHKDALGERPWFSQPCSFCVVKTPRSHPGAAVQGFLVFPTHQPLPKTSQSTFSRSFFPLLALHEREIPQVVLSCSHTQADGFASLQPLWEPVPTIPSSPGLSGHNLGEKPHVEGIRLAPALPNGLDTAMSRSHSVSSHSGLKNACPCCHHHLGPLQASTAPWQAAACCASVKAARCRSWLPAAGCLQRCRSRCERQRPGRGRARCRWERVGSCSQQQQRMLSLCHRSALPSLSPPSHQCLLPHSPIPVGATPGVAAVTPAQPLRETGHPGTWLLVLHAKMGEVFPIIRQTGNPGLVL